jgi:hypothetical protein
MWILFRDHGILPGQFYNLPEGEKVIIAGFVEHMFELKRYR